MTKRRQRMLLTVVAVAGSVALYGCGGGGSGPDKTPFNQEDVDKAAAQAKEQAETRADAMAKAIAAAGRAASEAKKADDAAKAAAAAAVAAATAATTAGLSVDEAMKQKEMADNQRSMAAAASTAAAAAASDAAAQVARHKDAKQHSDAAMASAKAAKTNADMAAASAMAAARSLATAQSVKRDRDATAGLATAAGVHVQTAKAKATAASNAAMDAKDQVEIARAATTEKAAEDARTAAMKARKAAADAAKEADDAAKEAQKIESDAAAVAMEKTAARKYATAAMKSSDEAGMYFDRTAGYADARMARKYADAGKDDLASHMDLKDRVKWIDPAKAMDGKLDDAAKRARNAAERLAAANAQPVIDAYKGNIADALSAAKDERSKAGNDLATAMDVYNKAKPWSENTMEITDANRASGKTLRHRNNKIALDNSDVLVLAAWQSLPDRGAHDVVRNNLGVVSLGGVFTQPAATPTMHGKYQMYHNNRWTTDSGTVATYDFVSFGLWARAAKNNADAFDVPAGNTVNTGNEAVDVGEVNTFVFAESSKLAAELPNTGTATFTGSHVSHVTADAGTKGQSTGATPVAGGLGVVGAISENLVEGPARITIDFVGNSAALQLDNHNFTPTTADDGIFYDVVGIKLTGNRLSGGTYSGRTASGDRSLAGAPAGRNSYDPLFRAGELRNADTLAAAIKASTLKLQGGVFGDKAQEVAGTVSVDWMMAHGAAAGDVSRARNASISIRTAFGARNDHSRTAAGAP